MGFRSTFITEDIAFDYPDWFREKYKDNVMFGEDSVIASLYESKTYGALIDLPEDIQKVFNEQVNMTGSIVLIYLHECGGITRVEIHKDKILYTEPISWKKIDNVEHNYCYGCSAADKAEIEPGESHNH